MQKKLSSLKENHLMEVSFKKKQCQIVILTINSQNNVEKQTTINNGCKKLSANFIIEFNNCFNTLGQFGSEEQFCEFLNHTSNYSIDFQQNQLKLKWKIVGYQFRRKMEFKIKLVPQQLNERQSLQCQVIILRKKLADYQKAQQKRAQRNVKRKRGYKQIPLLQNNGNVQTTNDKKMEEQGSYSSQTRRHKKSMSSFLEHKMTINQSKSNQKPIQKRNKRQNQQKRNQMRDQKYEDQYSELSSQQIGSLYQVSVEKKQPDKKERQKQKSHSKDKKSAKKQKRKRKKNRVRGQKSKQNQNEKQRSPSPEITEKDIQKYKIDERQQAFRPQNTQNQTQNAVSEPQKCPGQQCKRQEVQAPLILSNERPQSYLSRVVIGDKTRIDFVNGDSYFGHLLNNSFHGFGQYKSLANGTYEGQWKQGKANGYGVTIDPQGNRHQGLYKNDNRHGFGKDFYPNGQKYEGNFSRGYKKGYGVYYYANGDRYEGYWRKDCCHGEGKQIYTDGTYYEGTWRKDEKDGPGILYSNLGNIHQIYQKGQLIHSDYGNGNAADAEKLLKDQKQMYQNSSPNYDRAINFDNQQNGENIQNEDDAGLDWDEQEKQDDDDDF